MHKVEVYQEFNQVLIYPFIVLITWLPASINRVIGLFGGWNYYTTLLQVMITHSQGFWNALVYGRSKLNALREHKRYKGFRDSDLNYQNIRDSNPKKVPMDASNGKL